MWRKIEPTARAKSRRGEHENIDYPSPGTQALQHIHLPGHSSRPSSLAWFMFLPRGGGISTCLNDLHKGGGPEKTIYTSLWPERCSRYICILYVGSHLMPCDWHSQVESIHPRCDNKYALRPWTVVAPMPLECAPAGCHEPSQDRILGWELSLGYW